MLVDKNKKFNKYTWIIKKPPFLINNKSQNSKSNNNNNRYLGLIRNKSNKDFRRGYSISDCKNSS